MVIRTHNAPNTKNHVVPGIPPMFLTPYLVLFIVYTVSPFFSRWKTSVSTTVHSGERFPYIYIRRFSGCIPVYIYTHPTRQVGSLCLFGVASSWEQNVPESLGMSHPSGRNLYLAPCIVFNMHHACCIPGIVFSLRRRRDAPMELRFCAKRGSAALKNAFVRFSDTGTVSDSCGRKTRLCPLYSVS